MNDLKFAFRQLLKNPGFTAVAVLTLALGIGANTAIFSVVNAVLLRSLPYDAADRIVQIVTRDTRNVATQRGSISLTDFADWKEQNRVFQDMAYFQRASFNLTRVTEPKRIRGAIVSAEFFKVLATQPTIGRTFLPEEDVPGRRDAVILSHGVWQREFGGRPNIIGQVLHVDAQPLTVIGVMPAEFNFPMETELWVPFSARAEEFTQHRHDAFSTAVARLRSGVSLGQAQAEMDGLAQRLAEQYPQTNRDRGVRLDLIHDDLVRDVRPVLTLLLVAVGLVLLIGCANVANLLLARALRRQREIALRGVLGAGRGRLIRQLLSESALLAVLGGLLGVLLAYWITELLRALAPATIPRMNEVKIDFAVLSFSLGLSVITGVLFGLVPALYSSGRDFTESLGAGIRGTSMVARSFARKALVMSEVGLAVLLLISAGLLVKSMFHLLKVEPGFDTTKVVSAELHLPTNRYTNDTQRIVCLQRLLERVAAVPGDHTAGIVRFAPFAGNGVIVWFETEGQPTEDPGRRPNTLYNAVSGNYFQIMGIPILRGRSFTEDDRADAPGAVLINQAFVRRWFPNEDPLAKRLRIEAQGEKSFTIVGVVGDTHQFSLAESAETQIYMHYPQLPKSQVSVVIRTGASLPETTSLIRLAVRQVDADLPIGRVSTFEQLITGSVAEPQFRTLVLASLAILAVLLAIVGLYGLLAYSVEERTREIGVRMALGAQRADVIRLILRQGIALVLGGIVIGIITATVGTSLMRPLLFEVGASDFAVFTVISLFVGFVALLACSIPALRASRVDPMEALRYE